MDKEPKDMKSLMAAVGYTGEAECFEAGFKEESKEHPEVSKTTVAHLVADHLAKDEDYYEENEDDEGEEFDNEVKSKRFERMSKMMKKSVMDDKEAEKAGEYD